MPLTGYPYKSDCIHFRGELPCAPHKSFGVHCKDCSHFQKQEGSILVIKLGATGDVIRTTPLLHRLRSEFPHYAIHWITYSPEILPSLVHKAMMFSPESVLTVQQTLYDIVINLDKDPHACALANSIVTNIRWGFVLRDGKPAPANDAAEHKFLTGLFDDVNKANTKSYTEEIFEICGWKFAGEEYILDRPEHNRFRSLRNGTHVVGLNTGCGERWTSRRWKEEYWIELVRSLTGKGYSPLLLGGRQEHEFNMQLAASSGAMYHGHFPMKDFIALVDTCDTVVTTVTLALHISIALGKHVILMNNIFNRYEFELYGRGEVIEPSKPCQCFFQGTCTNDAYSCMEHLKPESVIQSIERHSSLHPVH